MGAFFCFLSLLSGRELQLHIIMPFVGEESSGPGSARSRDTITAPGIFHTQITSKPCFKKIQCTRIQRYMYGKTKKVINHIVKELIAHFQQVQLRPFLRQKVLLGPRSMSSAPQGKVLPGERNLPVSLICFITIIYITNHSYLLLSFERGTSPSVSFF